MYKIKDCLFILNSVYCVRNYSGNADRLKGKVSCVHQILAYFHMRLFHQCKIGDADL